MPIPSVLGPRYLAVLLVAAAPFLPRVQRPLERNAALDVELVRSAECEYKGITASFEELTRAYALQVYEQPAFAGWTARPHPRYPETEALVSGRFAVAGLRAAGPQPTGLAPQLRAAVDTSIEVTWCLNTLSGVRVTPGDGYARDALAVYRQTVDGFLGRMVYLTRDAPLRAEPSPAAAEVASLELGQVLLRERRDGRWVYARVPSSRTAGWLDSALVERVNDR
ncbi:MAG: hypothetical protein ABIL09_05080 [Gemmatimonadota bacterium]